MSWTRIWWDLLILVTYGVMAYRIIVRAIAMIDQQATITVNQAALNQELSTRELDQSVQFGFAFSNPYSISASLRVLAISITNTSAAPFYIDWDRSSLTDIKGRSRRVIRLTVDKDPDLIRPQVLSVIPPGQVLQEVITAEDVLSPSADGSALEPVGSIISVAGAMEDAPLVFYLCIQLVTQQPIADDVRGGEQQYLIPCAFQIFKSPWTKALPW